MGENLGAGEEPALLDGESLGRLHEYHGSDLAVEGWWQVPHRYLRQPPEGEPELVGYRIILTAAGEDYYWPSRPAREIPLIYDAGDYKQFAPALRGRTARLNIEALVEELCAFSCVGVDTMLGLNGDRSLAPEDLYLCYHRHPEDYGADLTAQGRPPRRPLTGENVLDAALACEGVGLREADGGLIVYHRDLVEGDLFHFYNKLAELFGG